MQVMMYCQACRLYIPLTVSAGLDLLFGLVQLHTCPGCGRIVGAIKRDAAEVVKEGA